MLDILIIGGGPIGIACGLNAKKAGLRFLIVEKGCLVNSIYNYPSTMTFFSTSEKLEIGGVPFVTINNKPTRSEALEYYRRVATSNHLPVNLFEEVLNVKKEQEFFTVTTSKNTYQAKNVILSTGFYDIPVTLNIPGEELLKVKHYYKDPHYYAMQKLVVVGSSNSAIDVALETYRKGAEVTLVIRDEEISPRVKYWVRPDIINRIKEGSIKAYFNSNLINIREQEVDIHTPDGLITIPNDFVMAMTGYKPNFGYFKKLGIALSEEKMIPQYNPETMETNIPNFYLAGVVCGGMDTHLWFIENSRVHADIILEDIRKKESKITILNSDSNDIDTIFEFYDLAIAHQKQVFNKHWQGFSKDLIDTEIAEKRQYKILVNGVVACIFAVTFNDALIWKERDQHAIYIHRIVTHPDFRGFSFVKEIIKWAKQYAMENSLEFVRMDTWADNEKLLSYYTSCGFDFTGTVTMTKTDGLPKHYEGISLNLFEIKV
jgi:thioredoxin reductase (NADPH)